MSRVMIIVEGQTEEMFVNEVLCNHLSADGVYVTARLFGNVRRRGGIRGWNESRRDIVNHLKADTGCAVTLMVDYYGLPSTGPNAWPGRKLASTKAYHLRAKTIRDALLADVVEKMGDGFDSGRFIPFVLMHEFEGLLFSDCKKLAFAIGQSHLEPQFQAIRDQFQTPEEINDSPTLAPSKRILGIVEKYQKPLFGNLAAMEIGLDTIRRECPQFAAWLELLKSLGQ